MQKWGNINHIIEESQTDLLSFLQAHNKIDKEIKKKLKNHKYSFVDVWKITGCGEKTLRRYMDAELICPIKTSDEWYFTQQQLDKCNFMHKMKQYHYMTVRAAAGLFDYMISKKVKVDVMDVLDCIKNYEEH